MWNGDTLLRERSRLTPEQYDAAEALSGDQLSLAFVVLRAAPIDQTLRMPMSTT
jgi:hypothetical protein